jgi:hypothetical protein
MGTYTYKYKNGSDQSGVWTSPSKAWDRVNNTYAYRNVPAGEGDENKRLNGLSHDAPSSPPYDPTLEQIDRVYIGVEGYNPDNRIWFRMRPVFGGSTPGTSWGGVDPPSSDNDTPQYYNVTNDGNAPSPWTWNDVLTLDMRVWAVNVTSGKNAAAGDAYVDQLYVKVITKTVPKRIGFTDGLTTVFTLLAKNHVDRWFKFGQLNY